MSATSGVEQHDLRADRRAQVLLELDQARARRRARQLVLRLPRSLPLPDPRRPESGLSARPRRPGAASSPPTATPGTSAKPS